MINGQTWRRHVDQIRKANSVKSDKILEEELPVPNVSDIQLRSQEVLADVTNSKELSSVNQGSESSVNDKISVDSSVTQVKDVKPKETSGKVEILFQSGEVPVSAVYQRNMNREQ